MGVSPICVVYTSKLRNENSTAELATGVTLVCVPTLGSLLQNRVSKPSARIAIGSKRSRSIQSYGLNSTDKEPTVTEGEYFELKDRDRGHRRTRIPTTAFINEITGREGDIDSSLDTRDMAGGIRKVVKIEQSEV